MIPLNHDRRGAVIPLTFRGANQEKRELALLQAEQTGKKKLKSSQWKGAKPQLRQESHLKCAYCDAPAASVAHCDVEHYRPKGIYWWLALCYDNYLYACQICNQVHKGDRFPVGQPRLTGPAVTGLPEAALQALVGTFAPDPLDTAALQVHHALWAAEMPQALNPYLTDPELLFAYSANSDLKELIILPDAGASSADQKVAQVSIDLYGLNREELCRQRYLTYEILELAHLGLRAAPTNTHLLRMLEKHVSPAFPFSGMSRYFVRRVWRYTL